MHYFVSANPAGLLHNVGTCSFMPRSGYCKAKPSPCMVVGGDGDSRLSTRCRQHAGGAHHLTGRRKEGYVTSLATEEQQAACAVLPSSHGMIADLH